MLLSIKKKLQFALLSCIILSAVISCGSKDESALSLSFSQLGDLGPNFVYEGWLIIDGIRQSTGIFNIDDQGNPFPTTFDFNQRALQKATTFIITIEPSTDPDPAASGLQVISGDFNGSTADLTIGHVSGLATNFSTANGSYILATPTDELTTNELSGIWFTSRDSLDGSSLTLPALPTNWTYESWTIIDEIPLSMGTFDKVDSSDNVQTYGGFKPGYNFPGEDFLQSAPSGLSFPTNLSTSKIAITVEPIPDNGSEPFSIWPLVATIDSFAQDSTSYLLNNNILDGLPTGTATR